MSNHVYVYRDKIAYQKNPFSDQYQPEQTVPFVYDDSIWKHIDKSFDFYCDKPVQMSRDS